MGGDHTERWRGRSPASVWASKSAPASSRSWTHSTAPLEEGVVRAVCHWATERSVEGCHEEGKLKWQMRAKGKGMILRLLEETAEWRDVSLRRFVRTSSSGFQVRRYWSIAWSPLKERRMKLKVIKGHHGHGKDFRCSSSLKLCRSVKQLRGRQPEAEVNVATSLCDAILRAAVALSRDWSLEGVWRGTMTCELPSGEPCIHSYSGPRRCQLLPGEACLKKQRAGSMRQVVNKMRGESLCPG